MKSINIKLISERDQGIYEALNKGIQLASGEIIGILHSDDQFYDSNTLKDIIDSYILFDWDVLHGDLVFETKDGRGVQSRIWKSSDFKSKKLKFGWMPPHPTMFIKRDLINRIGYYNTSFKISGDYDFVWRLYRQKSIKSFYLPRYITRMQFGGISNGSLKNLILKYKEDYKITKLNTKFPLLCLFFKNISKIHQIFTKT
jgi:glycosyltransferase